MGPNERTSDVFEHIEGYEKPPLISIPEVGDLSTIKDIGIKPGRFSNAVVRASLALTGFNTFHRELPDNLEHLLRTSNVRGAGLFAPIVSATVGLVDDPRGPTPFERAATLLFGARRLYDEIAAAKFPQDMNRKRPLEMGQYPNLFSTCLVVENGSARIYKSKNTTQITVLANGRFYILQVGVLGVDTSFTQLVQALQDIYAQSREAPESGQELSAGTLTCASHASQVPIFSRMNSSEINRTSLEALRESFTTVCLDLEDEPADYEETSLLAQSTNCRNRWHHASLQIVVFGNAKACTICNFNAYVDGNPMARGTVAIHRRAVQVQIPKGDAPDEKPLTGAQSLKWEIPDSAIEQAVKDLNWVKDDQQATFEMHNIGRERFTQIGLPPVPAFILALQLAARSLTGENAEVSQFLAMSGYRCMDLDTAVVTTQKVRDFVDYMQLENINKSQAIKLLTKAMDSQAQVARLHRRKLSFSKMLGLFVISKSGFSRVYTSLIIGLTTLFLRLFGLFKPPVTDIIVSHPAIYPEIPVIGRPGIRLPYIRYFGLHYQVFDDRIVITFMPGVTWEKSNQEIIEELQKGLDRILMLVIADE